MVLYSGQMLICVESFFLFEKKSKYYCTREADGYFYVYNNTGKYGVHEFKISSKLKACFKIIG